MYIARVLGLILIASTFALWCCAPTVGALPTGREALREKYREIEAILLKSDFGIPIYLESFEEKNALRGDVYGIIEYPFESVGGILLEPANWSDIALLHFNIKACTCRKEKNEVILTFYSGRKFYQPPEDTYQLKYTYRIPALQSEYLKISLSADAGPLNTRDYRVELEAAPLDEARTLIHFSYAYRYGLLARMAMKGYLATFGRSKVGFTVLNTDSRGDTSYVGGIRGVIERNAVRYYLAIQAYMDTLRFPEEERFKRRISRWYDLTDRYQRQLFEMSKEEYLKCKRREHGNQVMLQREVSQYEQGKGR